MWLVVWMVAGLVLVYGDPSHRKLPDVWLEKPRELKEGPTVLAHCGGPTEWGVPACDCTLTS